MLLIGHLDYTVTHTSTGTKATMAIMYLCSSVHHEILLLYVYGQCHPLNMHAQLSSGA